MLIARAIGCVDSEAKAGVRKRTVHELVQFGDGFHELDELANVELANAPPVLLDRRHEVGGPVEESVNALAVEQLLDVPRHVGRRLVARLQLQDVFATLRRPAP